MRFPFRSETRNNRKVFYFGKAKLAIKLRPSILRIACYRLYKKIRRTNTVCYTCICGDYDNLESPYYIDYGWDYICFTDNQKLLKCKKIGVWEIRPLVFAQSDQTRNARWHKTHPHVLFPEYKLSIWADSNINILSKKLSKTVKINKNLLVPYHFTRDCIYEECQAVIDDKKDTLENVERVKSFLTADHMPAHYGLNETNIIIRHHDDPVVKKIMEEWWSFIEKYTKRDQLSFSYILWKNGINIKDISFDNCRVDNLNFCIIDHKGK